MQKVLMLIAGVALLGFAGIANAEDTKPLDEPTELTAAQMDTVTAGRFGDTGSTGPIVIYMGPFKMVYDGTHWTFVWN